MEMAEMNQLTVKMALAQLGGDADENIARVKESYDRINNDYFQQAKKELELILFRLYDWKFFIRGRVDAELLGFLDGGSEYFRVWERLHCQSDQEKGKALRIEGLKCIQEGNYSEAWRSLWEAALCCDVTAWYHLGVMLANGEGCREDPMQAAYWYWKAAGRGDARAMMNLAIAYRNGSGVKENGLQMLYLYAAAAEKLLPHAVYNLGLSLQNDELLSGATGIGARLRIISDHLEEKVFADYAIAVAGEMKTLLQQSGPLITL